MANNDHNLEERISRNSPGWNFGKFSRFQAEQLLINEYAGTFLIRESEHYRGDFTLSVNDETKTQHYRIKRDPTSRTFTIDEQVYFSTLDVLVQHYQLDADGLCCRLEKPLNNEYLTFNSMKSEKSVPSMTSITTRSYPIIEYKDLQILKLIGSGEFAEVYEGIYKQSRVAIKMLKVPNSVSRFRYEIDIMSSLKHKNLVELLGIVSQSDNPIYLVTEFMAKGSLLHYLTTRGRSIVFPKNLLGFAIDVCEGLTYLEQCSVIHRDIAASNVLIADDNTAKISDFGLAIYLNSKGEENGNSFIKEKIKCRTKWTAPEALESKIYSHKSDVWSYGIFLWEIYSYGRCPYPRIPVEDVLYNLIEGYRMDPPDGCPVEIGEIMLQTWHFDRDQRPSFNQILEQLKRIDLP